MFGTGLIAMYNVWLSFWQIEQANYQLDIFNTLLIPMNSLLNSIFLEVDSFYWNSARYSVSVRIDIELLYLVFMNKNGIDKFHRMEFCILISPSFQWYEDVSTALRCWLIDHW